MRKLLMVPGALASLLAPGLALADHSRPLSGVVKSVDPARHMVVLEDGTRVYAADGVEVDRLQPGTKLILYTHTINGRKTVVSYEFAR